MLVLIVDDHPLLRQAIRGVIESHFPSSVVREASTGEEAVRIVQEERVEVAILDIGLPDFSGLTV
ncbi:MAG: response regulator transcription factor [Nitrospira sp.]|nr:response regulator transcription factor [Nitrospira sp.]